MPREQAKKQEPRMARRRGDGNRRRRRKLHEEEMVEKVVGSRLQDLTKLKHNICVDLCEAAVCET